MGSGTVVGKGLRQAGGFAKSHLAEIGTGAAYLAGAPVTALAYVGQKTGLFDKIGGGFKSLLSGPDVASVNDPQAPGAPPTFADEDVQRALQAQRRKLVNGGLQSTFLSGARGDASTPMTSKSLLGG